MITYHPSLLNESSDPEGSERFENVNIILEEINEAFEDVTFYNDIEKNNRFIIEQHDPTFKEYRVKIFKGTVLKEKNGDYSWWRNIL